MLTKIIGISMAAALVLFSMFAGGNGASLADSATVKQDEKTIVSLIAEIEKTQARYENIRGVVAPSITAPATDDGGFMDSAVALDNAYTDLMKMVDGSKFTGNMIDGMNKETYLDFSGIKFYAVPVTAIVQLDRNGTMGNRSTYKLFIDLNGYTGNQIVLANLESTICDKAKEKFGEKRTQCGGTEETISAHSSSTEIKLSNAEVITNSSDGDGLIAISVVDKEDYN